MADESIIKKQLETLKEENEQLKKQVAQLQKEMAQKENLYQITSRWLDKFGKNTQQLVNELKALHESALSKIVKFDEGPLTELELDD